MNSQKLDTDFLELNDYRKRLLIVCELLVMLLIYFIRCRYFAYTIGKLQGSLWLSDSQREQPDLY